MAIENSDKKSIKKFSKRRIKFVISFASLLLYQNSFYHPHLVLVSSLVVCAYNTHFLSCRLASRTVYTLHQTFFSSSNAIKWNLLIFLYSIFISILPDIYTVLAECVEPSCVCCIKWRNFDIVSMLWIWYCAWIYKVFIESSRYIDISRTTRININSGGEREKKREKWRWN